MIRGNSEKSLRSGVYNMRSSSRKLNVAGAVTAIMYKVGMGYQIMIVYLRGLSPDLLASSRLWKCLNR